MLSMFRSGKGKDEASRSSSSLQTPLSTPGGKSQSWEYFDASTLYKADFATYFGKAMFDCGLAKAILHLDMVKDRVDMDEVIKQLEDIYRIPSAEKSDTEPRISGFSLFTCIFHRYNSKDSPEDMVAVQQKFFSDITATCKKLQKRPVEMAEQSVRRDSPFDPPASVSSDLLSEAGDRTRGYSSPPSEYCPTPPSVQASQVSYPRFSAPPQTPPRSTQASSPSPMGSPNCKKCRSPTVYKITKTSNRNNNGGRPYYKCDDCGAFHSFADSKGLSPQNPRCQCGRPSRLGQASQQKGGLHFYVCSTGDCDFYREPGTPQSQASAFSPSPIPEMQGMSLKTED